MNKSSMQARNDKANHSMIKENGQRLAATASKMGKNMMRAGVSIAQIKMPQSLQWIFGLGFKIGVFLVIKSCMILWYLGFDLSWLGFFTILNQAVMGFLFIGLGAVLQVQGMYERKSTTFNCVVGYALTAITSLIMNLFGRGASVEYFKEIKANNWFLDLIGSAGKGLKEVGLSILFVDRVLWMFFSWMLLFVIGTYYMVVYCQVGKKQEEIMNMIELEIENEDEEEMLMIESEGV